MVRFGRVTWQDAAEIILSAASRGLRYLENDSVLSLVTVARATLRRDQMRFSQPRGRGGITLFLTVT